MTTTTSIDLEAIQARIDLAQDVALRFFGKCAEPPAGNIDDDGFVLELIRYKRETGLSLDWILMGRLDAFIADAMRARKAGA